MGSKRHCHNKNAIPIITDKSTNTRLPLCAAGGRRGSLNHESSAAGFAACMQARECLITSVSNAQRRAEYQPCSALGVNILA